MCGGITEAGYRMLGKRHALYRCSNCSVSPARFSTTLLHNGILDENKKMQTKISTVLRLADDIRLYKSDLATMTFEIVQSHLKGLSARLQTLKEHVAVVEEINSELANIRCK